jgi:hypothetical protein
VAYKTRARIEQAVGKLKRFKRIALRYEKKAESFSAIVSFACGLLLVKSVHTAWTQAIGRIPVCTQQVMYRRGTLAGPYAPWSQQTLPPRKG